MIYKAKIFNMGTEGQRTGIGTFDVEAEDFLLAKTKIKLELKKRRLPPVRAMALKAQQARDESTADVIVYVQEPVQEEIKDMDYRWKKPIASVEDAKKRRRG